MSVDFLTLPDELQALANDLLTELSRRGYRCKAEPESLNLPATATIVAMRGHETHYFLVRQKLSSEECDQWHRYGCSCVEETRVTVCCPPNFRLKTNQAKDLRGKGIGLAKFASKGLEHDPEARDLAFHARAPDRALMKARVRELLGEALDRLERGDWRRAFEDACGILEEECRSYLLKNLKMGRVKYQSGSKIKIPTPEQIKRMPLGALKDIFCSLISQNQTEAKLCS